MKIGIDARMLGSHNGGLGRYVQELVKHLEMIDTTHEYVVFLKQDNWDLFEPRSERFKKVLADIHWYGVDEQVQLKAIIKKEQVDLMHFPHWNVPLLYNDPFVVTIHDLLLMHYPTREASTLGPVGYWFKNQAYHAVLRHAVEKARHVLAVSHFTKQDITATLGVPEVNITVTHLAPFTHGSKEKSDAENVLGMYGITKPYFLYVGVAFPHKNLEGLLRAWQLFEEEHGDAYQLVLVGKKNFFYERLLGSGVMQECRNVIYTDFVPDDELDALYRKAQAYVFPSLYEGFGLPPLEAMQRGVPVISSNRTCLPEVLGEAALYIDPENPKDIADAMQKMIEDDGIRFDLKQAAREELKRYSWERLAQETIMVYGQALN